MPLKFFDIKGANKRKHILSATHMKLGPAEDGGRKLASAATPNHSDGSKDFSLCSTGSIGIKNEERKKRQKSSALICLSYFPTVFNNVLLKQNNKQRAEKEKKFCRPLKST